MRPNKVAFGLSLILSVAALSRTDACTRVVYNGLDGTVMTARSMDWKEDPYTNLWIFPRGMSRSGETGNNSVHWTSKYGSVVASAYEICSTDGMNEKGLVANLLWLAESEYPKWDGQKPGLTIAAWVQYMLDNFATVDEAVAAVSKGGFEVVSDQMPDGSRLATLHLSISDTTGDNAIFEYVGGKLNIHHSKAYQVMTNSPVFDQQLALDDYWRTIGGTTFLPGTNRAADRFVRGIVLHRRDSQSERFARGGGRCFQCDPQLLGARWASARPENRISPRPVGVRSPTRKAKSIFMNRRFIPISFGSISRMSIFRPERLSKCWT